jgi:hypothetical protein
MEISNVAETGIEREMPPAPKPLHPRDRGDAGKRKRARAPPKKEAKKMVKTRAKREDGARKTVFPSDGAKVGIAVPPETARRLRQYRAQLEAKGGDRITMAEAVDKALRAAMR